MISSFTNINIEILVLVAVWDHPFIFQGCFKITSKHDHKKQFIFFRCECNKYKQLELIEHDFSVNDYKFTYLYNQTQNIQWDIQSESKEYAFYLLKYALNTTLIQMITRSKQNFISIDDVAMQAIVQQMDPFIKQELSWSNDDQDIGFAVAMDFYPTEEMGQSAVCKLLGIPDEYITGDYNLH